MAEDYVEEQTDDGTVVEIHTEQIEDDGAAKADVSMEVEMPVAETAVAESGPGGCMLFFRKVFSFLTGAVLGTIVGAALALLFTPASGEDLLEEIQARIQAARKEFDAAYEETYQEKEAEFERMKRGH